MGKISTYEPITLLGIAINNLYQDNHSFLSISLLRTAVKVSHYSIQKAWHFEMENQFQGS